MSPIEKYKERLVELEIQANQLEELCNKCETAVANTKAHALVTLQNISQDTVGIRIGVVCMSHLNEVTPLLRELRKLGLKVDEFDDDKKMGGIMNVRDYHLGPLLIVSAMMLEGRDTCKMVQVGVKEVPIYKMECSTDSLTN